MGVTRRPFSHAMFRMVGIMRLNIPAHRKHVFCVFRVQTVVRIVLYISVFYLFRLSETMIEAITKNSANADIILPTHLFAIIRHCGISFSDSLLSKMATAPIAMKSTCAYKNNPLILSISTRIPKR
jgi:hypothetical protein